MKPYTKALFLSLCIYFVDAVFYGQGGIALVTAVVVVLWHFPKIVMAASRKDSKIARERVIRAGIYALMAVMVFLTVFLNNRLAAQRAEKLIQACDQYHSKYRQYPRGLADLVPEFMEEIPRAKLTLSNNHFLYIYRDQGPLLAYYAVPPFGRRMYDFKHRQWRSMD